MAKDFSSDQGGIQSSPSTEFDPMEKGVSPTGFDSAPKGDKADFGPGAGIGNTRQGIH